MTFLMTSLKKKRKKKKKKKSYVLKKKQTNKKNWSQIFQPIERVESFLQELLWWRWPATVSLLWVVFFGPKVMSGSYLAPQHGGYLVVSCRSTLFLLVCRRDAQSVYCSFTFALFQVRCHITCFPFCFVFSFCFSGYQETFLFVVLFFFFFLDKAVCVRASVCVFVFFLSC